MESLRRRTRRTPPEKSQNTRLDDISNEAARKHDLDPLSISFVGALQTILDAIPLMAAAAAQRLPDLYRQLLEDIAACRMKYWRRQRVYPRVVKVKMSNFKLKKPNFKLKKPQNVGGYRDFEAEMRVIGATG